MDACTVGFFESTGKSVNIGLSMLGNLFSVGACTLTGIQSGQYFSLLGPVRQNEFSASNAFSVGTCTSTGI